MLGAGRIILVAHLVLSTGAVTGISQMDVAATGMVETRVDDSSFTEIGGNLAEEARGMELTRVRELKTSSRTSWFVDKKYNQFVIKYTPVLILNLSMVFFVVPTFLIIHIVVCFQQPDQYDTIFPSTDIYQKVLSYFMSPFLISKKETDYFGTKLEWDGKDFVDVPIKRGTHKPTFANYVRMIFLSLNFILFSTVLLASSNIMFRVLAACVAASQLFFLFLNALIHFSPDYVRKYVEITKDGYVSNLIHKILMPIFSIFYAPGFILLNLIPVIQLIHTVKWLRKNLNAFFSILKLFTTLFR